MCELDSKSKINYFKCFEGNLRAISEMANSNPLALSLKPQPHSPAERLAAQQRDHRKLQRERQLKELAEADPCGAHACCSKNKPPLLTAPSDPFFGASHRVS